jgi:hypothetical protein
MAIPKSPYPWASTCKDVIRLAVVMGVVVVGYLLAIAGGTQRGNVAPTSIAPPPTVTAKPVEEPVRSEELAKPVEEPVRSEELEDLLTNVCGAFGEDHSLCVAAKACVGAALYYWPGYNDVQSGSRLILRTEADVEKAKACVGKAFKAVKCRGVSLAEYQRLQSGMSYREVIGIIGCFGTEAGRSEMSGNPWQSIRGKATPPSQL